MNYVISNLFSRHQNKVKAANSKNDKLKVHPSIYIPVCVYMFRYGACNFHFWRWALHWLTNHKTVWTQKVKNIWESVSKYEAVWPPVNLSVCLPVCLPVTPTCKTPVTGWSDFGGGGWGLGGGEVKARNEKQGVKPRWMNFTGFFFLFPRKSGNVCLQVAGVNEDWKLGFPTDPPVSELSVPFLPLSHLWLWIAAFHEFKGKNKKKSNKEETMRRTEAKWRQGNIIKKNLCMVSAITPVLNEE